MKSAVAVARPKKLTGSDAVLRMAERRRAALLARDSLIDFTRFTMPAAADPDDHTISRFLPAAHHRLIASHLEKVDRGEIPRLIITMPPRHGKSELCSRRMPAWFMGRDPTRQIIFATYNQTFAEDFGGQVREIIGLPQTQLVFPELRLKTDSRSRERMETTGGGTLFFAGADGSVTGRGADLFLIDDPFKNREDAESESTRRKVWEFFTSTAYTRLMPGGAIVIILTRWHEDDIVGRIFDPRFIDPEIAAEYTILSLPALAEDEDPLGRKPGEALWPERYPADVLNKTRRVIGTRDWASLYQQHPTPEDGDFFTKDMFLPYTQDELPENIQLAFRIYGASDHAVGGKQSNDRSCVGCVGFDARGDIWILPDLVWERLTGDQQVEVMVSQMLRNRPQIWWAEKGHISSSIGPYLRKAMLESSAPTYLQEKVPNVDKRARAQSIRARAALRPIRVPAWTSWWPRAEKELLSFPNGRHDDFVDWLSWIGLGLESEHAAVVNDVVIEKGPPVGSANWVVWRARFEAKLKAKTNKRRGW